MSDLADVYAISKEQLIELERIGDKMAQNLVDAIVRSKTRPLPNLIYALGIRHVGYETAELLVSHFGNMDALIEASLEDLTAVPTIGPRTAQSFFEYLHDEQNAALIAKLRDAGVNMVGERVAAREGPLTGLSLVVSGSLTRWSRNEIESLIKGLGGAIGSSVTKKTNYLVAGESPGSKLAKATSTARRCWTKRPSWRYLQKGAPVSRRRQLTKTRAAEEGPYGCRETLRQLRWGRAFGAACR